MTELDKAAYYQATKDKVEAFEKLCEDFKVEIEKLKVMRKQVDSEYEVVMQMIHKQQEDNLY